MVPAQRRAPPRGLRRRAWVRKWRAKIVCMNSVCGFFCPYASSPAIASQALEGEPGRWLVHSFTEAQGGLCNLLP